MTDEVAAEIVARCRKGSYLKQAALSVDVDITTLNRWLRDGKLKPNSRYGRFARDVRRAQNRAEVHLATYWYEQAIIDPDQAARYLSVRWRKRWNPTQKMELTGKDNAPLVPHDQAVASLVAKLERLEAAVKDGKK